MLLCFALLAFRRFRPVAQIAPICESAATACVCLRRYDSADRSCFCPGSDVVSAKITTGDCSLLRRGRSSPALRSRHFHRRALSRYRRGRTMRESLKPAALLLLELHRGTEHLLHRHERLRPEPRREFAPAFVFARQNMFEKMIDRGKIGNRQHFMKRRQLGSDFRLLAQCCQRLLPSPR